MRNRFDLDGKIALVTGASKEMGAAVAATLAEFGADVAVNARDRAGLEQTAAAVRAHGRRALVVPADLLRMDEIPGIVDRTVEGLGGLDILVNVAGSGPWSNYDWTARLTVAPGRRGTDHPCTRTSPCTRGLRSAGLPPRQGSACRAPCRRAGRSISRGRGPRSP